MEKWIPKVIAGYILFVTFIATVTSYMHFDANALSLTDDQKSILSTTSTDALTILYKLYLLGTINSGYAFINFLMSMLSIVFVIAVWKAIKEIIPGLSS